MSGICGIFHLDGAPVERQRLESMAEASAYCGPHGRAFWVDDCIGFGHLALHTTPESVRESQPLVDGELVLVADARVDDREHLMRHLRATGHLHADAPTDVDLILAAYRCWGKDWPEHVRGDYAVALWDGRERALFLVRDATGIRPLHYHYDGRRLLFGSDARQVLADSMVPRDLDGYYLSDWLTMTFGDEARTPWNAVHMLRPGFAVRFSFSAQGAQGGRWWHPERCPEIRYGRDEEYVAHFRDLFNNAVSDRLRSKTGHVAITVSGGLDSSSIAAAAQSAYTTGVHPVCPVGYHFDGAGIPGLGEADYARSLETCCGLALHTFSVRRFNAIDHWTGCLDPEAPIFQREALMACALDDARSRGCDSWLTGHGGDGLFVAGAWDYYRVARNGQWWHLIPWLRAHLQDNHSFRYLFYQLLLCPILPDATRSAITRSSPQWRSVHRPDWVIKDFLSRTDPYMRALRRSRSVVCRSRDLVRREQARIIVGAAQERIVIGWWNRRAAKYSQDLAAPYCDARLAEYMMSVPLHISARPGAAGSKWVLRAALCDILPEPVRTRKGKAHASAEVRALLNETVRDDRHFLLQHMRLDELGLVNERALRAVYQKMSMDHSQQSAQPALYVLGLETWLRAFGSSARKVNLSDLRVWEEEQQLS